MGGEWEVQNRDAAEAKIGVVDRSAAADVNHDLAGEKTPLGVRHLAGGDGAVDHDVVIGPGLFDDLASKKERIRGAQDGMAASQLQANRPDYVLELAFFRLQIVGAARGLNEYAIRTPDEQKMSLPGNLSRVGVVGGLIARKGVGAVVNLNISAEGVDRAVFFLPQCANGDWPGLGRAHRCCTSQRFVRQQLAGN